MQSEVELFLRSGRETKSAGPPPAGCVGATFGDAIDLRGVMQGSQVMGEGLHIAGVCC